MQNSSSHVDLEGRYSRQILFRGIGQEGQERIRRSRVVLVGCGGLGTNSAQMLARAGVGRLTIVDDDYVVMSNLQRQSLFDETDAAEQTPKAEAARRKLNKINSEVEVLAAKTRIDKNNVESYLAEADLVLDGTDNMAIRYLLNDASIKHEIPWIYGACLADHGLAMVVMPAGRPCLRCLYEQCPEPGEIETNETAGILATTVSMVAAFQVNEALKILSGQQDAVNRGLFSFTLWENRFQTLNLDNLRDGCPCCRDRLFEYLG